MSFKYSATVIWLTCLTVAIAGVAGAKPVDDALAADVPCTGDLQKAKDFRTLAVCEAKRVGLPPELAATVMEIESGFNPGAVGDAGEIGLMQVMPPTARLLGFQGDDEALADPATNVRLGVAYLAKAHTLAGGDLCTTVMKYRAGHAQIKFSARSVAYCLRARKILTREGYRVTGKIPVPTVGSVSKAALVSVSGVCVTRNLMTGLGERQCFENRSIKVTRHTIAR
jgi:hypothetical protein